MEERPEQSPPQNDDNEWIQIASDAYLKSTTYFDNNLRKQLDNNYRHFQSRHHAGSKYYRYDHAYRSKLFRPKTRSAIRNQEAAAAAAFFANQDVVSIEAQNENDPVQKASADVMAALVQYRFTVSIPWFLICIGAYQDAMVPGIVISYQHWDYQEKEIKEKAPVLDYQGNSVLDDMGEAKQGSFTRKEVIKDKPMVKLVPRENFRFDPGADWTDIVNTSPYLIELIPMYIIDVRSRMTTEDTKTGQPKWKNLSMGTLFAATKQRYDTTRQTREYPRTDKTDSESTGKNTLYDIVWVHRNIVKIGSQDWIYYTLGIEHLLSTPMPLEKVYPHGRPYAVGVSVIETHKTDPSGLAQLGETVQQEINENVNQRMDNVKLALNKRYLVKRGAQVDLKSIVRNAAGSVTMVNNVNEDVREMEFNDITSSAFQEQDRLNVDFDEVVGNFSVSSVQTNRRLNETVGGMSMIRGNANTLTEYSLRTFAETWVEPVVRQIVKLEQRFETDETILALAAEKAKIFQKYGINEVTDHLLNQELTTTVSVGMGATDPIMRMQNFMLGLRIILEVLTTTPPGTLDVIEVSKEVFGYLGFKDGTRFFVKGMGEDPEKMQMQQIIQQLQMMIQQLQMQIETKAMDNQTKLLTAGMKERGQDRRTAAQLATQLKMKQMDLLNPVVGENKSSNE